MSEEKTEAEVLTQFNEASARREQWLKEKPDEQPPGHMFEPFTLTGPLNSEIITHPMMSEVFELTLQNVSTADLQAFVDAIGQLDRSFISRLTIDGCEGDLTPLAELDLKMLRLTGVPQDDSHGNVFAGLQGVKTEDLIIARGNREESQPIIDASQLPGDVRQLRLSNVNITNADFSNLEALEIKLFECTYGPEIEFSFSDKLLSILAQATQPLFQALVEPNNLQVVYLSRPDQDMSFLRELQELEDQRKSQGRLMPAIRANLYSPSGQYKLWQWREDQSDRLSPLREEFISGGVRATIEGEIDSGYCNWRRLIPHDIHADRITNHELSEDDLDRIQALIDPEAPETLQKIGWIIILESCPSPLITNLRESLGIQFNTDENAFNITDEHLLDRARSGAQLLLAGRQSR